MLTVPDLRPFFTHTQVLLEQDGDICLCDPDFCGTCGYMSSQEVAILYRLTRAFPGRWADIGGHTGWSAAHIASAGAKVHAVDPDYTLAPFRRRTMENLQRAGVLQRVTLEAATSEFFFKTCHAAEEVRSLIAAYDLGVDDFAGASIDGHHTHPHPLEDAQMALPLLAEKGVLFFHDYGLESVKTAVEWVRAQGLNVEIRKTMRKVAFCWRNCNLTGVV